MNTYSYIYPIRPLMTNVYNLADSDDGSPPPPQETFMITEDAIPMITEDGQQMIKE